MTNGYKVIDMKSPTIYEDIEANYRKPLLFTNIEIDGVEKDAVFASVLVEGSNFIVNLYNKTFTISQDNEVVANEGGLHLYQHNIQISYDNQLRENQIAYFQLLTNNSKIFTLDLLKEFFNKYKTPIMCVGTVNSLNKISIDNETLPISINFENEKFIVTTIADDLNSVIDNVAIIYDNIIKIF